MDNFTINRLKKYFPSQELYSILVFSIISLLPMLNVLLKNEPLGFNDLSPMWSLRQLFRAFDLPWDHKSNLGTPNFLFGNALYNIPIILFTLMNGNAAFSHKIWMLILFIISGHGFHRLFKNLFNSYVIGIIAGIYGIINYWIIYTIFRGHNLIFLSYAILPYLISLFLKSLKKNRLMDVISTGLLNGLMLLISPQIGYIFLSFILIYALVDSFLNEKKIKRISNHIKHLVIIISLSLIIYLPVLVNVFYLGTKTYTIRREEITMYIMDINRAFTSNLACTIQTIIILLTGIYMMTKNRFKILKNELKSFSLTLLILTAVGFVLFSGVDHSILTYLYRYIPGFMILREINKVMIIGVYLLSLVLSLILYHLKNLYSSTDISKLTIVSILIGSSILYPLISGDFSSAISTVELPSNHMIVSDALGSDVNYYRLAFLPPAVWATCYNSSKHFFLDPMVSLQEKPTLEIKSEMDTNLAACFSRWIYYNIYGKRVNKLGSLLGLTGVKYVILRNDVHLLEEREDLRIFSHGTSKEIVSGAENLKKIMDVGQLEIFETDSRLPHVYASDKVSLVVGDRRALLSLLDVETFDPASEPPLFLDNVEDINDIFDHIETVYLDPLRLEDLILALSRDKILIKAWEHLPITSNVHKRWIRGEFAWFMRDGVADVAPDGYTMTLSGKPLRLKIKAPETAKYRLLVQCFLIDDDASSGIRLRIDDFNPEEIKHEGASPLGNYRWMKVADYELESGLHTMEIDPIGDFAAISKIALVPEENYEETKESLKLKLKNKRICYILEDYDWSNGEIDEIIEDMSFSNGCAVKLKKGNIPLLIPENSPYKIHITTSGYGSVTVSISKNGETYREKLFLNTDSLTKTELLIANLSEGWNNLKLRTEGHVLVDELYLEPPNRGVTTAPPQPAVEMISGSRYTIENVSQNFLIFLEGWSEGWTLRTKGEVTSSMIVLGFANLFRVPEGSADMEIEFRGARLMSTYSKISVSLVVLIILIPYIKEKYGGMRQPAI